METCSCRVDPHTFSISQFRGNFSNFGFVFAERYVKNEKFSLSENSNNIFAKNILVPTLYPSWEPTSRPMGKYSGTVCPVRSVLVFSWRPLLSSCPRLHCPAYQYKTVEESSTRKWQKKLRTVVLLLHKIRKRIVIYIKGAKSQFLKKHHLSVSFRGPPQYLLSPDVSMVWATTIMVNGFLPATIVLILSVYSTTTTCTVPLEAVVLYQNCAD